MEQGDEDPEEHWVDELIDWARGELELADERGGGGGWAQLKRCALSRGIGNTGSAYAVLRERMVAWSQEVGLAEILVEEGETYHAPEVRSTESLRDSCERLGVADLPPEFDRSLWVRRLLQKEMMEIRFH